jgi:carboxypeptidase Taq
MELMNQFYELVKKRKAYSYALNVVGWDSATEAPKNAFPRRMELLGILSGEMFQMSTSEEYQNVVNGLVDKLEELSVDEQRQIKLAKKGLDKILKIPKEEYVEYRKLVGMSQRLWEDAKANNDFKSFEPNLTKIVEFNKKFVSYYELDTHPYNVLLDDYEEDMTMKDYDAFFNTLRRDLVPFVKEVLESGKKLNDAFASKSYDSKKQKEFCDYLIDVFSFDRDSGLMKESVHPFTWNTHPKDVRFTTRYLEDMVFSSIFAAIHELGHATYEQQVDDKWDDTTLNGGASMGIHESQSRFYENVVGRSPEFWQVHFPKFKEIFPEQLQGVTVDDFHRAVNKVEASLIRVEADELTYPLHIMLRYEIERMLMSDEVQVSELPELWNQKMVEYLGIKPNNDADGVLQDVHWSAGLMGYFPTYALGTAYAAQIYYTMQKEINVEQAILDNDIKVINNWLKEKIHQFGSSKTAKQLIQDVTGEPFDAKYYVQYLKEKYSKLYL